MKRTIRLAAAAFLLAATGVAVLPPSAAAVPTFTGTRIVIAGDISCPPGYCNNNAAARATAALVRSLKPTLAIIAGDIQYDNNERANYLNPGGFNGNWGTLPRASLYAAIGNHEYRVGSYAFDYWGDHLAPNRTTWYALNVNLPSGGHWRILVLDSNCGTWRPQPTCDRYGPMATFIRSALDNDNARCELLVFHEPAFATRAPFPGKSAMRIPWWVAEYRKADLVVSGHNHAYEYHYPQNHTGTRSSAGMRQIIVGTGGRSLIPFQGAVWPNSYYRNASRYGVLVLDLAASSWHSSFRTTRGETLDQHSVGCRW